MTTYYVDPVNGNDAAAGTSWVTAWKTLASGPTLARLGTTDSDEIRIAKSPDPVSMGNMTWTHNSRTITAASLTNTTVDNCESGWTAGLVTPTYTTAHYRQGAASLQAVLATTNGIVCYKAFTSADYSAKSRITFWVNFGTAVNYTAGCPVQVRLCSDTAGAVPVNTFTLPSYYYPANYWVPITVDAGTALGSAIQSISIFTTSAVSNTVRFDNIQVIEASSSANSLALTDVFSKDSDKMWYIPEYIDGTSIGMQGKHASLTTSGATARYYYKSLNGTETVATSKRWGFDATLQLTATATSTGVNPILSTAIANLPAIKTYVGGVNTTTDTVDGETWFNGVTGYGSGFFYNPSTSSVNVSNLSCYNFYTGWYMKTTENVVVTNTNIINVLIGLELAAGTTFGASHVVFDFEIKSLYIGSSNSGTVAGVNGIPNSIYATAEKLPILRIENMVFINDYILGQRPCLNLFNTCVKIYSTGTWFISNYGFRTILLNNGYSLLDLNNLVYDTDTGGGGGRLFDNVYSMYNTPPVVLRISGKLGYAYAASSADCNKVLWYSFTNMILEGSGPNATLYGNYLPDNGSLVIKNMAHAYPAATVNITGPGNTTIENFNKVAGDNRLYTGSTNSALVYTQMQTATTYTGASAWRYISGAAVTVATSHLFAKVACKAGSLVTITMRIRNQSAARLGGISIFPVSGMMPPMTSYSTTSGTWELVTATFTPTENTLVNVYAVIPSGSTSQDVYFDDLQVSQA